jgi:hypothetical protein
LLSNKYVYTAAVMFLTILLIYSCGDKKSSNAKVEPVMDFNDPAVVAKETQNVLGPDTKFAYKGDFDRDSVIEVAAGTEIENKNEWGIQFYLLKLSKNKLKIDYKTKLLNGSFKESLTKKIKFPSVDYELVYYNSQDYFLGSGGGEVYSYIVDFNNQKAFYAHLFSEGKKVSLYLSDNIENEEIKNFFIANFKRDYPNLAMASKDTKIDE